MSTVDLRDDAPAYGVDGPPGTPDAEPAVSAPPPGSERRERLRSLAVVVPLLVLVAVLRAVNMARAPQRIDDEGTYVAQAWAVSHLGELTHYTYWYDHPPLGWLQIAAWTGLTGAFESSPNAVAAGRQAMLVAAVVTAGLLWVVARRLDLPRWAAALAVSLVAVSPLAVQFQRTVYLDNVATPWVLGAFALALSPRRRLPAFAGAGLCFAVAALTKETSLLLLPALAWLMWQRSHPETRRYTLAIAASLLALAGTFYVLYAVIKGELVPGANRTSLLSGIEFQLGGRRSSGDVLSAGTLSAKTVGIWLGLDRVLPTLALVALPLALAVRRLRPMALGLAVLLAMVFRPGGYLPVPLVVAMLPLGALLVAGVAAAGVARLRRARAVGALPVAALAAVVAVPTAVVAVPAWSDQLRGLLTEWPDAPMAQASGWLTEHVPRGDRILTDDALWVDLVRAGRPRSEVVWVYKPDDDPEVPTGWRSYRWLVSTEGVRSLATMGPTLRDAFANAALVARFGTGPGRVEIYRIDVERTQAASSPAVTARTRAEALVRRRVGAALAANRNLVTPREVRSVLAQGAIDPGLLWVLRATASRHTVRLDALPAVPGEAEAGVPVRTAVVSGVDRYRGDAVRGLMLTLVARHFSRLGYSVSADAEGRTVVRFPPLGVPTFPTATSFRRPAPPAATARPPAAVRRTGPAARPVARPVARPAARPIARPVARAVARPPAPRPVAPAAALRAAAAGR